MSEGKEARKDAHPFTQGLVGVLRQVHPQLTLSKESLAKLQAMSDGMLGFLVEEVRAAAEKREEDGKKGKAEADGGPIIDDELVIAILPKCLPGEVLKHAISEGKREVRSIGKLSVEPSRIKEKRPPPEQVLKKEKEPKEGDIVITDPGVGLRTFFTRIRLEKQYQIFVDACGVESLSTGLAIDDINKCMTTAGMKPGHRAKVRWNLSQSYVYARKEEARVKRSPRWHSPAPERLSRAVVFPFLHIHTVLVGDGYYAVSGYASAFLTSVIEYLFAEILELAGAGIGLGPNYNATGKIRSMHIDTAIRNDEELNNMHFRLQKWLKGKTGSEQKKESKERA
mmetsp:Transcript_15316/g.37572  ORF Transcript_15316/g.37572 Transcript_15316/m.37572 type:complete len:339 (-) Transcript_15316:125-1141(-)